MPFLGSVYQIFGLYPEIYYGMVSSDIKEEVKQDVEQEEQEQTYE